jgi:phage baseplate assembly protein W
MSVNTGVGGPGTVVQRPATARVAGRGVIRPLAGFRFSHPDLDAGRMPGFGVTPTGRLELLTGNETLRQQLLLLISTVPGERVQRPDYGCELLLLTFSPNDETTAGLAIHYVRRAIERYAPKIRILALDAGPSAEDPGRLDITLAYAPLAGGNPDTLTVALDLEGS